MAVTGIDVSRHQGDALDFGAVKRAGHTFAILKATDGVRYSYIDWFHRHFPRVKAAGLVPGAYHFLLDHYTGSAQADYYVAEVNKQGGFGGVIAVLDVEKEADGTYPKLTHVQSFVARFRHLVPGHPLMIYTGKWFWNGYLGNPRGVDFGPLWHSEYEPNMAEVADGPEADDYGGWPGATLWQFTSNDIGLGIDVPGIPGRCDVNTLLRGTLAALTNGEDDMLDETHDVPIIRRAVRAELDYQAKLVPGIVSYERYLEVLLDAARDDGNVDIDEAALADAVATKVGAQLDPVVWAKAVADALPPELAQQFLAAFTAALSN